MHVWYRFVQIDVLLKFDPGTGVVVPADLVTPSPFEAALQQVLDPSNNYKNTFDFTRAKIGCK